MYLWRKKKGREQRAESPAPFALCTEKPEQGQSEAHLEQVSTTVPKSAILRGPFFMINFSNFKFKPIFSPLKPPIGERAKF